jgi:hypothetical protein
VLAHVGQRLLSDPVQSQPRLGGERNGLALDLEVTGHTGLVLELLGKLGQEVWTGEGLASE